MNWNNVKNLFYKFRQRFNKKTTSESQYVTPRRARRKFIYLLQGRRDPNRFRHYRRRRARRTKPSAPYFGPTELSIMPEPSAPYLDPEEPFATPVPSAPPLI